MRFHHLAISVHCDTFDRILDHATIHEASPNWIGECINGQNPVTVMDKVRQLHSISFRETRIRRPIMSVTRCLEYGETLSAVIETKIYNNQHAESKAGTTISGSPVEDVPYTELCSIPICIGSRLCPVAIPELHVLHGAFIVRGKVRYIPATKSVLTNYPIGNFQAGTRTFTIQFRSTHPFNPHRSTSTLTFNSPVAHRGVRVYDITVAIPFLVSPVSLRVLMCAMCHGTNVPCTFARIWKRLHLLGMPEATIAKYACAFAPERDPLHALEHVQKLARTLGQPDEPNVTNILLMDVFPHLRGEAGTPWSVRLAVRKLYLLDSIVVQLILMRENKCSPTDRDSHRYLRVTSAGEAVASMVRMHLRQYTKTISNTARRSLARKDTIDPGHGLADLLKPARLTNRIMSSLATGSWTRMRLGMTHALTYLNREVVTNQLRQMVSSQGGHCGKQTAPRILHAASYGYECPADTPDGAQIGLNLSFAAHCRVAPPISGTLFELLARRRLASVMTWFDGHEYDNMSPSTHEVFGIFGELLGWTDDLTTFLRTVMTLRRQFVFPPTLTFDVNKETQQFRFQGDTGRLVRPMLTVDELPRLVHMQNEPDTDVGRGGAALSFMPHMITGTVEYVNAAMECCLFPVMDVSALTVHSTHVEVGYAAFLGSLANTLPFSQHNQGPRLSFALGMIKQAISAEQWSTYLPSQHRLMYGQAPVVRTQYAEDSGEALRCNGMNVTVMVYPYEANQEDAILINQAAVDRGLFASTITHSFAADASKTNREKFCDPDPDRILGRRAADYSKLNVNGIPAVGTRMYGRDVVIGRTTRVRVPVAQVRRDGTEKKRANWKHRRADMPKATELAERDNSVQIPPYDQGTVRDAHMVVSKGTETITVKVVAQHFPEQGDKFADRHAQKGVLGQVVPVADMPYSLCGGWSPDLIVAPEGFPSRMTQAKILEILLGKAVVATGDYAFGLDPQQMPTAADDSTSGTSERVTAAREALHRHGFTKNGTERFVDGRTGEMIQGDIYCGVMYYYKLNHMVSRKHHVRSGGPVQINTRQPTEGRKQAGGLRFGTMEFDTTASHGVASILRERTVRTSDAFECPLCKVCGAISIYNKKVNYAVCKECNSNTSTMAVPMGYSSMVMSQELAATGIRVRIFPTDC